MSRVPFLSVAHAFPVGIKSIRQARFRDKQDGGHRASFLVTMDDQGRPTRALWVDVGVLQGQYESKRRTLPLELVTCIERELAKQAHSKGESCPS